MKRRNLILKGEMIMSGKPKGPKQQDRVSLPKSPKQPYGEPTSGSHKVKNRNHTRQKNHSSHDM